MIANRNHEHNGPLTWVGRVPVYLATILAAVQFISMALTALLLGVMKQYGPDSTAGTIFYGLIFNSAEILHWQVWRTITYGFVNPPEFFFVFQIFMFGWFGAEVEKFLGRKSLAILCTLLLFSTPVLLTVLTLAGIPSQYMGAGTINLAVFLAFCMIYPQVDIGWGLEARWLGVILAVVNSLIIVAYNPWTHLAALWFGVAVAAIWLSSQGVEHVRFPSVRGFIKRKHSESKLSVVRPRKEEKTAKSAEAGVHDSIDPILEKIARQGIGSLSRGEREKLERARAALLEKERGH